MKLLHYSRTGTGVSIHGRSDFLSEFFDRFCFHDSIMNISRCMCKKSRCPWLRMPNDCIRQRQDAEDPIFGTMKSIGRIFEGVCQIFLDSIISLCSRWWGCSCWPWSLLWLGSELLKVSDIPNNFAREMKETRNLLRCHFLYFRIFIVGPFDDHEFMMMMIIKIQ